MDYFLFILIILALVGIMFFINRWEKRIKMRYKKAAYGLLETSTGDPKTVRETIKGLRLYGGRFFKDKECIQLADRLRLKYGSTL